MTSRRFQNIIQCVFLTNCLVDGSCLSVVRDGSDDVHRLLVDSPTDWIVLPVARGNFNTVYLWALHGQPVSHLEAAYCSF